MKKIVTLTLAVCFVLFLFGCNQNNSSSNDSIGKVKNINYYVIKYPENSDVQSLFNITDEDPYERAVSGHAQSDKMTHCIGVNTTDGNSIVYEIGSDTFVFYESELDKDAMDLLTIKASSCDGMNFSEGKQYIKNSLK